MTGSAPFVFFGTAHLAAIALTFIVPLVLAVITRTIGGRQAVRFMRYLFAAELIATWILWYWLIWERGWISWQTTLPMHLCDWATITALITLLWPNQRTYELAYFWSLSGTVQALLTPELFYDFPDLRFIVFFAFHGGVIAAVLYLTVGARMRPYPSSIPRVLLWSLVYLAAAGTVDWLLHVNYGFLAAKPAAASLLDFLGPWPWYIASLAGAGVVYVLLLYSPFYLKDKLKRQ
ncbi:MAG TPA: TIGR02206 family membrane protein [Rhizomicrobium sp.]|jgi:hypothetical integral membrane protein (TIGR02206 family)|nr:TIGR02206 family membrane protein [Rhizomicrobium sp.]